MSKIDYVQVALGIVNKGIGDKKMPIAHYLSGHSLDVDDGSDYCYPCAHMKVIELEEENPDVEIDIKANVGDPDNSDTPVHCETCQEMLKYALTEHGLGLELDHFSSREFDLSSEEECYALKAILERHGEYEEFDDQIEQLAMSIVSRA